MDVSMLGIQLLGLGVEYLGRKGVDALDRTLNSIACSLSIIHHIKKRSDLKMGRSKRKLSSSGVNSVDRGTKAQRRDDTSKTVFYQFLTKAGYDLTKENEQNALSVDQAVFQRELRKLLKLDVNYPQIIADFIEATKEYLEDTTRLKWSLLPTLSTEDCISTRGTTQDSLIHLLMGIDILQDKLSLYLLEKMAELSTCSWITADDDKETNFPRLILCQFRWLDKLVCSKALYEKMLELLDILPLEIQKEIIISFPDIIDDQDHPEIARKLSNLLLENRELNLTILDTLGNLNIKPENISEIRQIVMKTLPSADLQDLPTIVKFILQSTILKDAYETILELRNNLDFTTLPSARVASQSKLSTEKSVDFLILDAVRLAVRFQKFLSDAWIKVINGVEGISEHKPLDFLVLLVLHSLSTHRKAVEILMRNKIRAGHFTDPLLEKTFASHASALREYFPSVLALAESFVRSSDVAVSEFGSTLYQKAFISFDTYCRQEVIGNLVTHVGSGTVIEINTSLNALECITKAHTTKVTSFGCFLKGILEYLNNLTLQQIRKLYIIISMMAYQGGAEGMFLQDDLHMVIRKQISSDNSKYRRIGIIGALMAVKAMTSVCSETPYDASLSTGPAETSNSLTTGKQRQAIGLLELVLENTCHIPEAFALFCDELSRIIQKGELDDKVEGWINDTVINKFQDQFIVDVEEGKEPKSDDIQLELRYGLDDDVEDGIALNLLPVVLNAQQFHKAQYLDDESSNPPSPITLSSLFRLLRICEYSQQRGSLDSIDALLGCHIWLPHHEKLREFSTLPVSQKHTICDTLFFCLNWFREVINSFVRIEETDMKIKVIKRLQHIIEIQEILQQILCFVPGYSPVQANFDIDVSNLVLPAIVSTGNNANKAKVKKSTSKKKEKGKEEKENNDSVAPSGAKSQNDPSEKNEKVEVNDAKVNFSVYAPYFRELDLDVFFLLQNGVQTTDIQGSDPEKAGTILMLHPAELHFLLEDMNQKLSHILPASVRKQLPFTVKGKEDKKGSFSNLHLYTAAEVASFVVRLLPAICDLMETINNYFKKIIEDSDGIIDGLQMSTEISKLLTSCMELLLQVQLTLFSWNGFVGENRSLLKEAAKILASRLPNISTMSLSIKDITRYAFRYIEQFADSLSNIDCCVTLVKLLKKLLLYTEDEELKKQLGMKAESFLKQEWCGVGGQRLKGKKINENIESLLSVFLSHTPDMLKSLEVLATVAIPELVQHDGKDAKSSTFPTLDRSTFNIFFRMMFQSLCENVKLHFSNKEVSQRKNKAEELMYWTLCVRIFHTLVNLIKVFDGTPILACSLKYGRLFVDSFIRHGMPLLDDTFCTHHNDAQSLLKTVQLSTRFLQHVCSHSKVTKNVTLTNQVPLTKRTLEAFVYRVKAMLALNKCKEAFWLGNLKNRDLQGEEILSQSSYTECSDVDALSQTSENNDNLNEMEEENHDELIENCDSPDSLGDNKDCSESF